MRKGIVFLTVAWLFVLSVTVSVTAQNPVTWQLETDVASGRELGAGEKVKLRLRASLEDGWHLYATDQPPGGPKPTKITIPDGLAAKLVGEPKAPPPTVKFDKNFQIDTRFFSKAVVFEVTAETTGPVSRDALALNTTFQVCTDAVCLPPKTVRVSFTGVEDVRKSPLAAAQPPPVSEADPTSPPNPTPSAAQASPATDPAQMPLSGFIWLAMTLGALSLLTPCVFPMIPITVSYFTNHATQDRGKAIRLATIYSVGIIATFTLVGMLLAILVGAAGINLFAANPYVNLLIAGVFFFFAFNLFGAYEIQVPSGLLNRLDSLTRSREGEGSGVIGALLMGLTFTLTSFTCTSPFVGTILVSASQGSWQMPLVGMLAYSTVFALPFFVLALAPQLVSQLPRAGGWMNSVKVAMGFLEVAAAMKFISNVDLVWKWGIFTRPVVLAIWIAIGVILALYLLGKFQLSHDSKPERIGAVRLLSAIISLAISFYLLTGLFGAKLGELESFLPPDLSGNSGRLMNGGKSDEPSWIDNDLDRALAQAKQENKRVFIDFTGYTCTNCRWMEANVFPVREVEEEMAKFVLVRLYTDGDGEVYERQQKYQETNFKTVALPFYAVLESDGRPVSTFPGLTRNTAEFVGFLQQALKN